MTQELDAHLAARREALERVRRMLVEQLKVSLPPEQIDLDAPLFGTGLGLDSIDAVELVVAIENEFELTLAEEEAQPWMFRTVHAVVDLVLDPPPGARAPAETPEEAS